MFVKPVNIFLRGVVVFLLLVSFYVLFTTHTTWWHYVNDKTLISFVKSLFSDHVFSPQKNNLSWDDISTKKIGEDVPLAQAIVSAQQVAQNISTQSQSAEVVSSMQDGPLINLSSAQHNISDSTLISIQSPYELVFKTKQQKPSAWISFTVSLPQTSNYVYFDLDFTSETSAQGIFTSFFDNVSLGYLDERFYEAGSKKQIMGFVPAQGGSTHVITLRLDQTGTAPSSVVVKNIGTGFFTE